MANQIKEYAEGMWWLLVIGSVVSILFGLSAIFLPGLTLATLILTFAVFAVVWGLIGLVVGLASINKSSYWWLALLTGIIMLALGVYLATNPAVTAVTFTLLIGWALVIGGVIDALIGIFMSHRPENKTLWILTGVIGVIAGIVIWAYPVEGSLAFVWVLGLYALILGAVTLTKAISMRTSDRDVTIESVDIKRR